MLQKAKQFLESIFGSDESSLDALLMRRDLTVDITIEDIRTSISQTVPEGGIGTTIEELRSLIHKLKTAIRKAFAK